MSLTLLSHSFRGTLGGQCCPSRRTGLTFLRVIASVSDKATTKLLHPAMRGAVLHRCDMSLLRAPPAGAEKDPSFLSVP